MWKGCDYYKRYNSLLTQVSRFKDIENQYRVQRQEDSSLIATQDALVMTEQEAYGAGILDAKDYLDVKTQIVTKTKIVIDSVPVPYTPPNYVDTSGWAYLYQQGDTADAIIDSVLQNSIIVPREFKKEDKWFSIKGQVKKDGIILDTVSIPNKTTVTVGYKKAGFLNLGRKQVVEVKNENPFLQINAMRNVIIKPNKSLLNNKVFLIGCGILGGLYISTKF